MAKSFGETLKTFRKGSRLPDSNKKVSQDKLADLLSHLGKGYTLVRETITRWENSEKYVPPKEIILDIANVLGLSEDERNELLLAAEYAPVISRPIIPSAKEETLKSNVIPIDVSLDASDRFYSQTQEGKIKKILPLRNIRYTSKFRFDIGGVPRPKNHGDSCSFPTIDFKFQNTGRADALIWQFSISIIETRLDDTPVLDFFWKVINNELVVSVTNLGWGEAKEFEAVVEQPLLNQVFSISTLCYTGSIKAGEEQAILRLKKELMSPGKFELHVAQNMKEIESISIPDESSQIETIRGISINGKTDYGEGVNMRIKWKCKTSSEKPCDGEQMVNPSIGLHLLLTESGFKSFSKGRATGFPHLPSDITYCSIIDPMNSPQERIYPISRKIDSGGVDRFHIMLGATCSCHLRVQFSFFIDKDKVVKSEEFEIEIWNPRKSNWEQEYADGIVLARKLCDIRSAIEQGRLLPSHVWKLKKIRYAIDNFPFVANTQEDFSQTEPEIGEYIEAVVSEVKNVVDYEEAAIILKTKKHDNFITLPISWEAANILSEELVKKTDFNSFDTLYKIISNLSGEIEYVSIQFRQNVKNYGLLEQPREDSFLGRIGVKGKKNRFCVPVNLSEALGIAIRTTCLIRVDRAVVEKFVVSFGEETLNDINRSLVLSPDDYDLLLSHASVLVHLKRFDEALIDCEHILKIKPDDIQTLMYRGIILAEKGDLLAALEQINRVITVKKDDPLLFVVRARVLSKLGKHEDALIDYKLALDLKPDDPVITYTLASGYSLTKDYDNALLYLEKAIKLAPKNAIIARSDSNFSILKENKLYLARFDVLTGTTIMDQIEKEIPQNLL